MTSLKRDAAFEAMEREAYEGNDQYLGLNQWAASHEDENLTFFPYDGSPDQRLDRVLLEPIAKPDIETARLVGRLGVGPEIYERTVSYLQASGIIEEVDNEARHRRSTLVASLHLRDTFDTAMSHNMLFAASDNPDFVHRNLVLSNYIMSLLKIKGTNVNTLMTASGSELRAFPDVAVQYVRPEVVQMINRAMSPILKVKLANGTAFHRALTGTRGRKIELKDGSPALMIRRIDAGTAFSTIKRTPKVVAMPMDVHFGNTKIDSDAIEIRTLKTEKDIHLLMTDMVEAVNGMTKDQVFYGLPKGAREVENNHNDTNHS